MWAQWGEVVVPAEDLVGEEEVAGRAWVGGDRLEVEGDERGLMTRRMGVIYEVSTALKRGLPKLVHIVMFAESVSSTMEALLPNYRKHHVYGNQAGVIRKKIEEDRLGVHECGF